MIYLQMSLFYEVCKLIILQIIRGRKMTDIGLPLYLISGNYFPLCNNVPAIILVGTVCSGCGRGAYIVNSPHCMQVL